MNKKNLSFMSLLTLSVALLGGCNGSDKNVSEIVLEVGDKKYTAEQLYNQLLSTGTGANEAFSIVLRLVIESSMETSKNIQTAADIAEETFEEEVETYATNNGITVKEARKQLLKEKGYESVEEMKADIIYNQKLTRVTEQYWETHKGDFYVDYIKNRLPYLVSHVLVKIDDNTNGNKIANNVNVSQAEAEKLHDVINRFKNGDEFSYIANHFSDDSGSTASGGAYYMDTTTGFVDEFLYGTYIFDAYTEKIVENAGEANETTYIKWGRTTHYNTLKEVGFINESAYDGEDEIAKYYENGLNLVTMDIVEKLGDVANKTSTGDFHYIGYVGSEDYVSSSGITEYDSNLNNLNSNYNAYARSIIFNRAFNKPGLSVIGYDTEESLNKAIEDGLENYVEIRTYTSEEDYTSKWVLTDEKGNPIFFVAAKGSSNDVWVHFLTINVSTLKDEEKALAYFTINPKDTDTDVYAKDPAFNIDNTNASKNTLIKEIESYIKSYVTAGSGSTVGEETLLSYKMLEDYMEEKNITWSNKDLETAIKAYITKRRNYFNKVHDNTLLTTFDKHASKLTVYQDELIQMGIKPYECAVVLESEAYAPINNSTSTGNLCRYVYGKGYQVKLSYYYHTDLLDTGTSYTKITTSTDVVKFNKNDNIAGGFDQWAYIGETVTLPTKAEMQLKDGYDFLGWYTTKDFKPESLVTEADLTNSSIYNHTIFYAKIVTVSTQGTYQVKYNYKYAGTEEYASSSLVKNTNRGTAEYSATGGTSNTYNDILKSNITSSNLEILGFDANGDGQYEDSYSFELDGINVSQGVTITVYVAPKATTFNYVFVDAQGETVDEGSPDGAPTSYTYNPATDAENEVIIDKTKFDVGDNEVKSFKFARTQGFADALSELELEETDAGTTITVYVIVGAKA